MICLWRFARP